jgi:hypothetical protein
MLQPSPLSFFEYPGSTNVGRFVFRFSDFPNFRFSLLRPNARLPSVIQIYPLDIAPA